MLRTISLIITALTVTMSIRATDTATVNLRIIETTDIHGNLFPYDFINRRNWSGSMARVASFVSDERSKRGNDNVILLDNGDILQGQPSAYYYNFIDTTSTHIVARTMNFMGYDAATIGNHDIETGHSVYDRWVSQCDFPVLGANIINTSDNSTYLKPYTIITRQGIRIAIFGLITPAIPAWLPENLWHGLRFDDMVATARHWIPVIRQKENPHLIIGLFHSGDSGSSTSGYNENASAEVARLVPGFDIIFMGHDHRNTIDTVTGETGHKTILLNPANNAQAVAVADINITLAGDSIVTKDITPSIQSVKNLAPHPAYTATFAPAMETVRQFVSQVIGQCDTTITTRDAYFGPSAFIDFIHKLQLSISGAQISFAAPLSYDATLQKGDITMSDMFNLYKFENMLYTMTLSGREIKDHLELSYDNWINTIPSTDGHLLKLNTNDTRYARLQNPAYNFDSAAGIIYTVDVTKPYGQRINISRMANGERFDFDQIYRVAINSYRGNGGGNLLTQGAKIAADQLSKRIIWSTDIDLRYHMMQEIKKAGTISPRPLNHWKFIPEEIVLPIAKRDRDTLFPGK